MRLATPEEDQGEPFSSEEPEESEAGGSADRTITLESTGQEMPVEEAINLNNEMLFGEVKHLDKQIEELQEENEALRETIEEMESALNILAAESNTNLVGQCNECGERAEVESRGFGKSAVVCQNKSCEAVMAEIR